MTVTTTGLSRTAGLAAAASGFLYGFVQFIHPAETVAAVATTGWAVTHYLTMTMAVLGIAGATGLYLRQVRESGILGLIGYVTFCAFFLLNLSFTFLEAFVLPELAGPAPRLVDDILGIFSGGDTGDLGGLTAAGPVAFALYLLGGLLFGVALFRARVLARWASILLAAGAVLTLAVPLVPHLLARAAAIPVAVAMIGLGISLWRDGRPRPGSADASVDPGAQIPAVR